jgi:hypothetical protein
VTETAPTTEHPCPILRRVRRRAKKSFQVSCGCCVGGVPAAGCDGAVDAFRTVTANLLGGMRRDVRKELRGCWALLERVHVEKEAVAVEIGAMIAGGCRLANALAGHRALRASIVTACSVSCGEEGDLGFFTFVAMSQMRAFGLGELRRSRV